MLEKGDGTQSDSNLHKNNMVSCEEEQGVCSPILGVERTLDVTSQPVANENNDQIGLEVLAAENRELFDGDKVSNAFVLVR